MAISVRWAEDKDKDNVVRVTRDGSTLKKGFQKVCFKLLGEAKEARLKINGRTVSTNKQIKRKWVEHGEREMMWERNS